VLQCRQTFWLSEIHRSLDMSVQRRKGGSWIAPSPFSPAVLALNHSLFLLSVVCKLFFDGMRAIVVLLLSWYLMVCELCFDRSFLGFIRLFSLSLRTTCEHCRWSSSRCRGASPQLRSAPLRALLSTITSGREPMGTRCLRPMPASEPGLRARCAMTTLRLRQYIQRSIRSRRASCASCPVATSFTGTALTSGFARKPRVSPRRPPFQGLLSPNPILYTYAFAVVLACTFIPSIVGPWPW
jgi:hypothetical protein